MAEHLRHEIARSQSTVRPSTVQTLAHFLDGCAALAAAPLPLIHLLIEEALERQRPPRFQATSEFPGLHSALAALFEEVPSHVLPPDLAGLLEHVRSALAARGMALRKDRLAAAGSGLMPAPAQIVLDGFFTFSADEIRFLESLSRRTPLVVTLPDWPAAAHARTRLLQSGFSELRLNQTYRQPGQVVFSAATIEREAEEVARRILEQNATGRRFREMGILLRTRDPYAPLLETTLARFGIPARSYFSGPLDHHPAVQFLWGVVRAMLSGWDHAMLVSALRMPVSGSGATAEGDALDFAWRAQLPGLGLINTAIPEGVTMFKAFDSLRNDRLHPHDWALRLKDLRKLVPVPQIADQVSREQVDVWRSTAAALDGFDAALDQTADALGPERGPIPLGSFCNWAGRALALNPLRVPDRRRDVVHIMDVFEARQWELPVVFVCGLTERHFPQYHREDPLLGDASRRRAGLETVASRQAQERSLFDFATSRATDLAVLSYPRFDQKGEDALRSFFLPHDAPETAARPVRPRPVRPVVPPVPVPVRDPDLLQRLAQSHRALSPSSVESFQQCAFQFFAGKTLRLRSRPPAPRDRLDMLAQGSIMHRALADWVQHPLFGIAVFDQVFAEECARRRVLMDYRTEAVRLELLRNFTRFIENPEWAFAGWTTNTEQPFEYPVQPGLASHLSIRGRIDRLAVNARGQALVIDYKYSAANKIYERVKESAAGQRAQAGLYLLAAERQFKLQPAGMLFCGLKKEVAWDGWHLPLPDLDWAGEACRSDDLRELMDTAERVAAEAHAAILSGTIAADPAEADMCQWCDFRDACRVETIAAAPRVRRGGAGA
jgi:hypothetical protein